MSLLFWKKSTSENKTAVPPYTFENESSVAASVADPIPVQIIHPDENDVPPVTVDGVVTVESASTICLNYVALTVDSTAGGVSLTIPAGARSVTMRLETAQIRWTVDPAGTTVSATVGEPLEVGDVLTVSGDTDMRNFRAIRTGGVSGTIHAHFYK